jgi:hypothetical protein
VKDRIQSWASLLVGTAVVVLMGWLTLEQMGRTHVRAEWDAGAAIADASAAVTASGDAGSGTGTGTSPAASGTMAAMDPAADGGFGLGSLNTLLGGPDGGAMPTSAPRTVKLGVVLVQFAGAEGASSSARAKPDALKHAQELAEQAKSDWKAAVKAGDTGSSEDIGRIPRGVLDRNTELAVFSLEKDGISDPLETPKGYWIVKRTE